MTSVTADTPKTVASLVEALRARNPHGPDYAAMSRAADVLLAQHKAIDHVLARIERDPRIAWYFDQFTESFAQLTLAYSMGEGLDTDEFRKRFAGFLQYEAPQCRSGKCAEKAHGEAA